MPDLSGFVPRAVMTAAEYLDTEETNRPRELTYGILRDAPGPSFGHQDCVFQLARALAQHVESNSLGRVAVAPIDVVLDADLHLIVQPDILFISTGRTSIIRDQIWGAPDLVVEVLSPGTASHDRGDKLGWYRRYGVREYWLVDPRARTIQVHAFDERDSPRAIFRGANPIASMLLPELKITAFQIFG